MHIVVENQTVRENLRAFIARLSKAEAKRERMGDTWMRNEYHAYLHRRTGHLYFADAHKQPFDPSLYKTLYFDYIYNPENASLEAMAYDTQDKSRAFQLEDCSPTAIHVIKETIQIINTLSDLVKGSSSSIITKVQDMCKLRIDEKKETNVLTTAWHAVDRKGAEQLLEREAVGTYLLREDDFAELLSERLCDELGKTVKCITLSILEAKNHICEYTLVHVDHRWHCYDNVDFCNGEGFRDLATLIQTCFSQRALRVLAPVERGKQRRLA